MATKLKRLQQKLSSQGPFPKVYLEGDGKMSLRPDEISSILKSQIADFRSEVEVSDVGTVIK